MSKFLMSFGGQKMLVVKGSIFANTMTNFYSTFQFQFPSVTVISPCK